MRLRTGPPFTFADGARVAPVTIRDAAARALESIRLPSVGEKHSGREVSSVKRRIDDSAIGPTTFVATSTRFVGTITGQGPYIFCGTVEGDCEIQGRVTLAAGAHWQGTIRATDVVIAGTVQGNICATGRIEITGTARISGSLSGGAISIAAGAIVGGDMRVTSEAATAQPAASSATTRSSIQLRKA